MLDKKTGNLVTTKNTANDYIVIQQGPVLVKGSSTVVTAETYKEGNNQVVEFTIQWQYEIYQMENQSSGWTRWNMNTTLKAIIHLQESVSVILRIMFYQADG